MHGRAVQDQQASNHHLAKRPRAHVHVVVRAEEIEFRVLVETLEVQYISKQQLSSRDEKRVLKFIEEHEEEIMEAWHENQKDQQK